MDELALLAVAEAEPTELLMIEDAQVMLGLEDKPEEELPVADADTLEEAIPEVADEAALSEVEVLPVDEGRPIVSVNVLVVGRYCEPETCVAMSVVTVVVMVCGRLMGEILEATDGLAGEDVGGGYVL